MIRALLKITGECDSACCFCHAGGARRGRVLPAREVFRRIVGARAVGCTGIVLSGGEPTRHPEVASIMKLAAHAGLEVGLVTNGIGLRPALAAAGVVPGYVHVSLHGSTAARHEELTGAPSFAAACDAVRAALRSPGAEVAVTTVAVRENLDDLASIVSLVAELATFCAVGASLRHRLAALEPKGKALRLDRPRPADVGAAMAHAIAAGDRRYGSTVRRGWDGLPLCLAPAGVDRSEHLTAHRVRWMRDLDDDRLYPVDHGVRVWPAVCAACAARCLCAGVYAEDLPLALDDLRPFTERSGPGQA